MSSNPGEPPSPILGGQLPTTFSPPRELTEDWTRDLVEHSRDLLCIHDLEGRLLSVNPVPARLLGYSVEEILGIPMRDLIDPAFRDQFDLYLRTIATAGQAAGSLAVLTRTGERRYWEYHCTLRTRDVEKPIVRGIAHDITDRLKAEKSLRTINESLQVSNNQQENMLRGLQLFRTLLDQSIDAIEIVDPETFRFLDVNEKSCAELGYTREEMLSKTIFDINPNLTPDRAAKIRESLAKTGFEIIESVHRRKDGTTFPVETSVRCVQLDREYIVAVSRDITARKRAEQALTKSEAELREAQELALMGSWHFDLLTETVTGADQLFRLMGLGPQCGRIPFRDLHQYFLPETWDRITECHQRALETGCPEELEVASLRPDGSVAWLLVRGKAETDESGQRYRPKRHRHRHHRPQARRTSPPRKRRTSPPFPGGCPYRHLRSQSPDGRTPLDRGDREDLRVAARLRSPHDRKIPRLGFSRGQGPDVRDSWPAPSNPAKPAASGELSGPTAASTGSRDAGASLKMPAASLSV